MFFMELPEEIEDLVLGQLTGELSVEEGRQLEGWINQSEGNRRIYTEYCSWWYAGIAGQRKVNPEKTVWIDIVRKHKKRVHFRLGYWITGIAACCVLFIGGNRLFFSLEKVEPQVLTVADLLTVQKPEQVRLVLSTGKEVALEGRITEQEEGTSIFSDSTGLRYLQQEKVAEEREQVRYNELIVPKCGEYQITLADGTRICMNSESVLRFPVNFVGETREVWLNGEAYFDVVRNEKRPFIVHMDQATVKVLGTTFNIMAYQEEKSTEVTLVEGKVEVATSLQHEMLLPGNQMQVDHSTARMTQRKVDVYQYVAWKDGVLRFDDMPLEQLVNRLSRWYNVSFEFRRDELKQRLFSGGFRRYEQLEQILDMVQEINDVSFKVVDNKVVIDKK